MNKTFSILLILLLVMNNITVASQVLVEKSDKSIVIFGKTYYLHNVKKGQTIYSICKVYNIDEAALYEANNDLIKTGLKYGTIIKIPVIGESFINNKKDNNADETYIYHKVEPEETLYTISNKYSISSDEIKKLNPKLSENLKIGQIIKLPKIDNYIDNQTHNYTKHVILPSETLFSIAQRYGVTMSDIEVFNPEIADNGIEVGQTLKIPKYSSHNSDEMPVVDKNMKEEYSYSNINNPHKIKCTSFQYNPQQVFKIAVMLPLFVQENMEYKARDVYYKNTGKFYEFYYGLMLAALQMKEQGISVEFYLEDTRADIETTKSILASPKMQDMDLIIGPIHSHNFKVASDFALDNGINIVAPFKLRNHAQVLSNPAVFLANPGLDAEVANISSHLTKSLNQSVLMLHNGTKEELDIINLFKKNLLLAALPYENINGVVFKNLNYKLYGISGVEHALSAGLYNVIIVPSNNQVFITNIATKLNYLTKQYKIVLYSMRAWEKLRNIEVDYLKNLGFHYGSTSYIDNKARKVRTFKNQYKAYFNDLPTHYSYLGYDIAYYFMNVLKDFGSDFQACVDEAYFKEYSRGLQFDFNFKQEIPYQGFENDWISIVKIGKHFELIRVN